MTCQECHLEKPDAKEFLDPYSLEVNDEKTEIILCENCYQERVDGV